MEQIVYPQQLKRVTRALWIGGALTVVIIVVTAWWLSERHRRELRYDGAVSGDVLVSSDGRTLTTSARWTPCHEVRPQLQAQESANTVMLVLKGGEADLRHQCKSTDEQVSTTLAAPLGARRLVDTSTGATITPIDSSQLADPRYLPAGYKQTEEIDDEPDTPPGERCLASPYFRAESPAWTRFYRKGRTRLSLAIAQVAKGTPDDAHGAAATIGGHPAHLQERSSNRCLKWSNGTYTFAVFTQDTQLTTDQLLQIAQQLDTPVR
ncbi:hypothetical protein ACFY2W_26720 [Streptomyces sp. NPDC001262]|uniref:hypothetical protein n=1 Tax=Streptomyces sp. NPDC001262 TaxID=3364552 RepID=UPI003696084D